MKVSLLHRRCLAVAVLLVIGGMLMAGAALAQGAPTVRVIEEPVVVQPPPFATRGETVVVPRTRIEIDEGKKASPAGQRPRKKPQSGSAAAQESTPKPVREAKPPPLPPAREIVPRNEAGKATPAAKSKILSGDPLGRKQKHAADNTDGED